MLKLKPTLILAWVPSKSIQRLGEFWRLGFKIGGMVGTSETSTWEREFLGEFSRVGFHDTSSSEFSNSFEPEVIGMDSKRGIQLMGQGVEFLLAGALAWA